MASQTVPPPRPAGVLHTPWREGTLQVFAGSDGAATTGRSLKNGVFCPPPGPRRTPDHPPYAEMIRVVLGDLAEDGGSTVDAISRRIAAIYLDLPWAHERLLPHYLGRLIAAGAVAVAVPGRYALLSPSPAPARGSNPNPNLNPSSQAALCAVNPVVPPVSADRPRRSSSHSYSAIASALDNGEAEGLGAQTLALTAANDSFGGNGDSQCHSIPATAATHGGHDVRLFVPAPTSATAFAVAQIERPLEENRPSYAVSDLSCSMESKFRGNKGENRSRLRGTERGLPPEGSKDHWQPASRTHISCADLGCILLSECGKDGPPKFNTLSRDVQERLPMSGASVPPNCKPTVAKSDSIHVNDNVHWLNSSSSGDPNHIEPNEDVCLHRSPGDVASSSGYKVASANCGGGAPELKLIIRLPKKPEYGLTKEPTTPGPSSLAEQVAVPVPKRPRTYMERKPKEINTGLLEQRVSNQAMNQFSEQIVYALPAVTQDSPQVNVVRNRPQIRGLVQVLLAVQPKLLAKVKKSRRRRKESEMVQPVEQFRPDNHLLTKSLKYVAQNYASSGASMTRQSDTYDIGQRKADENRAEAENSMQLISTLSSDHNCSLQVKDDENPRRAGIYDKSMHNGSFMDVGNVAHDAQDRQILGIGHSVLDGSLQTGNVDCSFEVGGCVELPTLKQFTSADFFQISMDNVENMEELMQLPVAVLSKTEDYSQREEATRSFAGASNAELPVEQLVNKGLESEPHDKGSIQEFPHEWSKTEDDLQAGEMQMEMEKIRLHSEKHVPEDPIKQFVKKDLVNEPQDDESIQEFPKIQSANEDGLEAVEMNESDAKRCLLMPCKFGDDLQTLNKNEQLSMEILPETTERQCVLGNSLQNLMVGSRSSIEDSMQESCIQDPRILDDLQSEKDKPDIGNCMKVLPREQAKIQNDLPLNENKNGKQDLGSMIQSSLGERSRIYSSSVHQPQEGSHNKLSNQKLSIEERSPGGGLQTDCSNELYAEKHEVLDEQQAKFGAKLLGKGEGHGRYDKEHMQVFQEKSIIHCNPAPDQEVDKWTEDEQLAQVIPMEPHPAEDYLQRKGCLDSHADEHRQVSLQQPHKPGEEFQMDGNMAHAEGPAFQLSLERSVCVSTQLSVSENSNRSKTCDPSQSKGDNLLFKKNKKHSRRLWFEG